MKRNPKGYTNRTGYHPVEVPRSVHQELQKMRREHGMTSRFALVLAWEALKTLTPEELDAAKRRAGSRIAAVTA